MREDVPRISIVIPTLRAGGDLRACLRSLRRSMPPELAHETIVVANGCGEAASALAAAEPRVRLLRAAVNLGFGGGCNLGARAARGELLVFLNDDAEVEEGWLEALVDAADGEPSAGAVGSLVLGADGAVQEAGSIVWRDGSTCGIDRGRPLDACRHRHVRPVDYASACSLLVRRAAWEAAGGFDLRYHPAYYEDVDLCFALRRGGWSVLLQPRSRIRHLESASSDDRTKRFLMLRNRRIFAERWAADLARHEPPAPASPPAVERAIRARACARRLLVVDDRTPDRAAGSGFGVLLDAIPPLRRAGWQISFAVTDRVTAEAGRIRDLGVEIVDERPEEALARPDRVYSAVLISRPHNFERLAPAVRRRQPQATLVYLCEALFHRRMEKAARLLAGEDARRAEEAGAEAMRAVEMRIPAVADRVVCVSSEEAEILASAGGGCPVDSLVPLCPDVVPGDRPFGARSGLLFVPGWLAGETSPNVDALRWFATEVWPRVAARLPDLRLDVTGADPPAAARALAGGRIRLVGRVADLAAAYARARLVVVPVRIGAGVKIKTIEALQHGVPLVATSVGWEGLPDASGGELARADEPAAFAERIVELATREDLWEARRATGLRLVELWRERTRDAWPGVLRAARLEQPRRASAA